MNNFIKLFFVFSFIFLSFTTFSQTYIRGGFNLSNIYAQDNDETYSEDFKSNPGFHIGFTMNEQFSERISLETGFLLNSKGFKYTYNDGDFEIIEKLNLYYAQVPITLKYHQSLSNNSKLYFGLGPYIAFGVMGNFIVKVDDQGNTETDKAKVSWGSNEDENDFKHLDYGLEGGIGVTFKSFQLGIYYEYGLANISPYTENDFVMNNRVGKLVLGYALGSE